jgi:NTE family protein
MLSPYVANPLNLNPLRDAVRDEIDFDNVRACKAMKLFISATRMSRPASFASSTRTRSTST